MSEINIIDLMDGRGCISIPLYSQIYINEDITSMKLYDYYEVNIKGLYCKIIYLMIKSGKVDNIFEEGGLEYLERLENIPLSFFKLRSGFDDGDGFYQVTHLGGISVRGYLDEEGDLYVNAIYRFIDDIIIGGGFNHNVRNSVNSVNSDIISQLTEFSDYIDVGSYFVHKSKLDTLLEKLKSILCNEYTLFDIKVGKIDVFYIDEIKRILTYKNGIVNSSLKDEMKKINIIREYKLDLINDNNK